MLLSLHEYSASKFYAIKNLDRLEEFYYKTIEEVDGAMADELCKTVYGADREYIINLIHEGRANASTAISTLTNLKWYIKNPEGKNIEDVRHKMYHYFMLYSVYLQSLIVYYWGVYKKR